MGSPDVSVVIALYNRADLVGFTLDSLAPERHPSVAVETIVVDDGSTDGGADIVAARYPRARVVRQENAGAPAARNRGIADARADALLLLDSDDLVEPGFFAPRLDALLHHPTADAAYGPWDHFTGTAAFDDTAVVPRHAGYPIDSVVSRASHLQRLVGGWYIPPATVLWRRSAVERVGGQNPGLSINQDVDLLFRVLVTGQGIVGCDAPRALYREHAGLRQGTVLASEEKARDLLELRREFASRLRADGLLGVAEREALGRYCFNEWASLRRTIPAVAAEFLELSRSLWPALQLEGRWPLRVASRVLGPERATVLRDAVAGRGDGSKGDRATERPR